MIRRMLILSLLGILAVGGFVAAMGAVPGQGPLAAVAALVADDDHGKGEWDHDDHDD